MSLQPEDIAGDTEHSQQAAFFCYANKRQWTMIFAIPNGGKRDPVTAARLKAEGVKAGVPDIFLPIGLRGYHGLFIEMKLPTARNQPSAVDPKQCDWHKALMDNGYAVMVAYGWEHAVKIVNQYLTGNNAHL